MQVLAPARVQVGARQPLRGGIGGPRDGVGAAAGVGLPQAVGEGGDRVQVARRDRGAQSRAGSTRASAASRRPTSAPNASRRPPTVHARAVRPGRERYA